MSGYSEWKQGLYPDIIKSSSNWNTKYIVFCHLPFLISKYICVYIYIYIYIYIHTHMYHSPHLLLLIQGKYIFSLQTEYKYGNISEQDEVCKNYVRAISASTSVVLTLTDSFRSLIMKSYNTFLFIILESMYYKFLK